MSLSDAEIAGLMNWRGPGAYTQHAMRRVRRVIDEAERRATADVAAKGQRLALELECLLMDTRDTAVQSKWWDSAHEALEQWRQGEDMHTTERRLRRVRLNDGFGGTLTRKDKKWRRKK